MAEAPDEPPAWLRALPDLARADPAYLHGVPAPPPAARAAAVLILVAGGGDGADLLLTERSAGLAAHAGQVSFPGGAVDPGDAGPADAALREATEELGLDRAAVDVIGELPALYIAVSGFAVTPVVAWWRRPVPLDALHPAEVASAVRAPFAALADPANRLEVIYPGGGRGPAFDVGPLLVWGFTGRLIDRLLDLGGWARPWEPARVVSMPPRELPLP